MFLNIDLTAIPVAELAEIAHAHRVAFFLDPTDSSRAIVRPHRDPAMLSLVMALRNRREELAAFLIRHRPPRPAISEREERYRRDVLHEPDIPIGELSWPILAAMVVSTVIDTLEAERAAAEWERAIVGRDPAPVRLQRPARPTKRRVVPSDRTVF